MFRRETLNFLLPTQMTYATPAVSPSIFRGRANGASTGVVYTEWLYRRLSSLTLRIVAPSTLGSQGDVCTHTHLRAGHPICLRLKHTPGNINSWLSAVTGYCVLQQTFRRLNKKIQADALSAGDGRISTVGHEADRSEATPGAQEVQHQLFIRCFRGKNELEADTSELIFRRNRCKKTRILRKFSLTEK